MRYTLTLNQKLLAAPLPFSQVTAAAAVLSTPPPLPPLAGICSGQLFEENPSVLISSGLLVQADEGVSLPVVDLIDESTAAYREAQVFL
ncbi:4-coumarate--CoA ligase-like 7 [Dorcoceras hygrometricum]|uniref:4-coumarate--CoA ligase-like 7 n=1 Tax=Dorcoceras hygrometricum TaxID=472368 RepID=A0A2Z6ZYK3_9LAMI|nr:4-coumarate--CoA ligase-like 7 [Dorcoceras hygrometricum]